MTGALGYPVTAPAWCPHKVLEEVLEWQKRPLDPLYPILYLDAIIIEVRDGHQVQNRAPFVPNCSATYADAVAGYTERVETTRWQ